MNLFRKSKRILAGVLTALSVLAGALCMGQSAQAAALPQAMMGIDVSEYQGDIDWNAVRASGVTWAMVRIGNTKYGLDTKFAQNMIGATTAGVRVGCYVYSYAKNVQEAAADAQLAVAAMEGMPVTFPVAFDFEDNSQKNLDAVTIRNIVDTFCQIIYNAGYTPMIYSYRNWLNSKIPPVTWDYWVAQYASATDFPYPFAMWQASCTGKVAGINGDVDIDYLYEDYFTSIIPNGDVTVDGLTYRYVNWRRTNGLKYENGVAHFYDVNGNMVKDKTVQLSGGATMRMCKDGHVAFVTAAMNDYAAAQQKLVAQVQQELVKAQAEVPKQYAVYEQAVASYQQLEAAYEAATQTAIAAAQAVEADPSNADLIAQQMATAQDMIDKQAAAQNALNAVTQAEAAVGRAQENVNIATQGLANQQNAAAAAAAALVLPE